MPRAPMPHVVVLLPGITGSILQKNGKDVWALSGSAIIRGLLSRAGTIHDLTLQVDSQDEELGDGVTVAGIMPDVHLIPGFWKIDGYGKVRDTLLSSFELTEGQNYFEFAYDWRRDNRVAARKLQRLSRDWLTGWRDRSGRRDARLVLVAHSMGGLVSRYFLEVLEGWRDTRALITFGTPYRGALGALDSLANGMRMGPFDLSAVLRSFTSSYQLLPVYEAYDPGDGAFRRVGETTGIPNVDAARAADALSFHNEIRTQVESHRRDDEYRERGYWIFPIVGIEQPTLQSAHSSNGGVAFSPTYKGEDLRGDGTVPRVSATPLEQSGDPREMYAATHHGALQNADAVLTHLAGVFQRLDLDLGAFRAPARRKARLSLAIRDAYASDEPIAVRVQPDQPDLKVTARVTLVEAKRASGRVRLTPRPDGWHEAEIPPLRPGVYRIAVGAGAKAELAEDIFAVYDAAG